MEGGNRSVMKRPIMNPVVNRFYDPALGELNILCAVVDFFMEKKQTLVVEALFKVQDMSPVGRRFPCVQLFEQLGVAPEASEIADVTLVKASGGENMNHRKAGKREFCWRPVTEDIPQPVLGVLRIANSNIPVTQAFPRKALLMLGK